MLQIKPLTEEEKKQKLAELRQKMGEKRSQKAEQEAKEHKINEALRRKAGKVSVYCSSMTIADVRLKDSGKIKEDLQLKQALKEAEQKKKGIVF